MNDLAQKMDIAGPSSADSDIRKVALRISRDKKGYGADNRRSALQLMTTGLLFIGFLAIMFWSVEKAYWLTLLVSVPAAGLLVRLFIFQHDCGHGSYFTSRRANDILGRVLSVFTFTPYGDWKRSHALHHATSGNLDRRGRGDVTTLTVREYEALSPLKKLGYRLYRSSFINVWVGAPLTFILINRLPFGQPSRDGLAWHSRVGLDLVLIGVCGLFFAMGDLGRVLAVYTPIIILGSWIGGWLFFVQHQFDDTYWQKDAEWNFQEAALMGSSYYVLPRILRWFSGNIGLHHVHHLCSRVPNYELPAIVSAYPELGRVGRRITLRESLRCWKFVLWDEDRRALVGFRDRDARCRARSMGRMRASMVISQT